MKKNNTRKNDEEKAAEAPKEVPGNGQQEIKEEETNEEEAQAPAQQADEAPDEIASLRDKLAASNDSYLRLAAEFDNYRRRSSKERMDLISLANEKLIQELLPIIDDFERALTAIRESDDQASVKEGTELIYNKIVSFLKKNGVKEIEAMGKEFDTDFHEAVAQIPVDDEKKKNKVVDVAQKGYMLGDKVIRYAKVVIGI